MRLSLISIGPSLSLSLSLFLVKLEETAIGPNTLAYRDPKLVSDLKKIYARRNAVDVMRITELSPNRIETRIVTHYPLLLRAREHLETR